MKQEYQRFEIQWQGLAIEILYCADWLDSLREIYGYSLSHLQVRTIQPNRGPLPLTETGYFSHFDRPENIEARGGPDNFVRAWLDEAAQSPEWKKQQKNQRQLSLF